MRIFHALFRRNTLPNGHIFRGKNRLVRQVTGLDVVNLRSQFELEERNLFYLRHAYLTPEQSSGHAKALGKDVQAFVKMMTRKKEFKDNITIEQMLGHLRHKEAWD